MNAFRGMRDDVEKKLARVWGEQYAKERIAVYSDRDVRMLYYASFRA